MSTPSIVVIDPDAPQTLSPLVDYGVASGKKKNVTKKGDYMKKYNDVKKHAEHLEREREDHKRMLLEMSGVINALKQISIDYKYEPASSDQSTESNSGRQSSIKNIYNKIRAVDSHLKAAMLQTSTIKAQEEQINALQEEINSLQKNLGDVVAVDKANLEEMDKELKIESSLESNLEQQIVAYAGSHMEKYAEIQAMERQLLALRKAQQQIPLERPEGRKTKHVTFTADHVPLFEVDPEGDRLKCGNSSSTDSVSFSSSRSSTTNEKQPHLVSISEDEGSYTSFSGSTNLELFADDKGIEYSSRSGFRQDGERSSFIHALDSDDEGVEVSIQKTVDTPTSDESLTTQDTPSSRTSKSTRTIDYAQELTKLSVKLMEVQNENEKLRQSHRDSLSHMGQLSELSTEVEMLRHENENLKQSMLSATVSQANDEQLTQHERHEEFHSGQGESLLQQQLDKANHELIGLYKKVETMAKELNESRKENKQETSAFQKLVSETDMSENANKVLQTQNDALTREVSTLSANCDAFKMKYFELLACDHNTASTVTRDKRYEMLRREYESILTKYRDLEVQSSSMEKLKTECKVARQRASLVEETQEKLKGVRDQLETTEKKVVMLQEDLKRARHEAKRQADKREEQRITQGKTLKDLLFHYRALEAEHEEVAQRLQRLQAKKSNSEFQDNYSLHSYEPAEQAERLALHSQMAAYEQRIKGLQQQRDAAIAQLSQIEEEVSQSRLEKLEAVQSRREREKDLKSVISQYRDLLAAHDSLKDKAEELQELLVSEKSSHTTFAVVAAKEPEAHPSEIFDASIYKMNDDEGELDMISEGSDQEENMAVAQIGTLADDGKADDDSVENLLTVVEELKRKQPGRKTEWRGEDQSNGGSIQGDDLSSVSNVTEGMSLDNSQDDEEPSSVLSDEAPSTTWKDVKIAKLMHELERAKLTVQELEDREKIATTTLGDTERKLLEASREATDAQRRQIAKESSLRDAVAQHKRLEAEFEEMKAVVASLQEQLEQAKTKARLAEEEAKAARRRASENHNKFKKLEVKHEQAMQLIEEQEREIEMLGA